MLTVSQVRHQELPLSQPLPQLQLVLVLRQAWELRRAWELLLAALQEHLASQHHRAWALAELALGSALDEVLAEEEQVLVLAGHRVEEAEDGEGRVGLVWEDPD